MGRKNAPDATMLLMFRSLLEQHNLTSAILAESHAHFTERGLLTRQGTAVDATIIAAPSSTKNEQGKRHPEMHRTKKGNQQHCGLKMHLGVDAESGLIRSLVSTAAKETAVMHIQELLHGLKSLVHVDSGYTGVYKRDEITQAQGDGRMRKEIDWRIAMKRGELQAMADCPGKALCEWFSRRKAQSALANLNIAWRRLLPMRFVRLPHERRPDGGLETLPIGVTGATSVLTSRHHRAAPTKRCLRNALISASLVRPEPSKESVGAWSDSEPVVQRSIEMTPVHC